jgi:hypothetical protein
MATSLQNPIRKNHHSRAKFFNHRLNLDSIIRATKKYTLVVELEQNIYKKNKKSEVMQEA